MEIAHNGVAGRLRALPTRLINQVALVADRATERALEDTGSRRHHYALLTTLREFGPASQADLGRRTRIDRSDIVAALNDLADRGFVERNPDPGDRRRNIVTLTRSGARHLDDLDGRLDTAQDELLAALSAAERRQLVGLLTRILDDHSRS
ncbi:DNA-binding transcriptional regulator, MarR family [Nocardia amikacinitolerans]|uniref:DNA-binding transcriptional regulator, MarR family n=1 Tax=Nocardia amikacinitolerans TaxID=756689 RepID=A0A285LXT1_9NOCA|nr:MarR family transcriptional regulator [Nocardia amikacinitolerans]MCP2280632.1 DNA-binding transcriptional regulator, MarR family [Nocardia amikacinitolerans]MCP2299260.1 DNA-binding transcriptional regulator, MarR family [Nocardia amikacinitolerans]SNY89722.1 DNA-binding transcriptional regulator, MarR family [Nocardia amikacinitolerans]